MSAIFAIYTPLRVFNKIISTLAHCLIFLVQVVYVLVCWVALFYIWVNQNAGVVVHNPPAHLMVAVKSGGIAPLPVHCHEYIYERVRHSRHGYTIFMGVAVLPALYCGVEYVKASIDPGFSAFVIEF